MRADSIPPDWEASLCVGGRCFLSGVSVPDSLSSGEIDSLITVDIFTSDSIYNYHAFVEVNVRSSNVSGLIKTLRIWIKE